MRKIYSILLIACSMLISANIQAAVWEVNTFDSGSDDNKKLEYAWNNAVTGDIIKLTGDITMTKTLFLGSKTDMEATSKSIVLDINGQLLQGPDGSTASSNSKAFTIAHGELVLRNSVPGEGSIQARNEGELFFVMGSTLKNCKPQLTPDSIGFVPYYSHVLIEKGVTLTNASGNCISIDVADKGYLGNDSYNCNIFMKNETTEGGGVAFGARVDVYGEINAYKYGIKVNGDVRAPQEFGSKYLSLNENATYPGGAKGDYTIIRTDSAYVPFVFVHKGAKLTANANYQKSTAIYSSGYGRWQIEGECEGSTGVYIKSGIVTVKDATIKSTYLGTYNRPRAMNGDKSGIEAGGSGLVVESNSGYSGYVDVTITGDTYVKGGSGYAVDEIVTNPTGTKVEAVNIEGGTIESGSKGAVIIDKNTNDENKVVVVGGTTQQQVTIYDPETKTEVPVQVEDLVPPEGYTSTTIVTPEKTVVVVTPTTGGMAQGNSVALAEEDKYFVWVGTEETLVADKTMSALEINNGVTQVLTIGDETHKVTYTVGRVILGLGARIIVNPGSKLIVNGAQGLVAEDPSCVLLRANASEQATFVISPEVTSNKQPNATVQLYTTCYKDGENSWKWQRFASPLTATTTVTHDQGGNIGTSVKYIDDLTEAWTSIAAWSDLKAFTACAIANNTNAGGATYTFSGKLMGNVTDSIKRKACKWNYYGNSFMAPMSVKALSTALPAQNVDPAIYYWDMTQGYRSVTAQMITDFSFGIMTEIPAMGFFVLKNNAQEAGALNIDYNNSIFRYAQGLAPVYNAPVRQTSNSNRVCISIVAENGKSDVVYMLGSDNFTPEYEAGADVEKLMNNGLNLYVAGDINLSALYTDNLLGATLTLQANEAINYTMTFNNVNGDYALRDNMTGKTIAIVEGATYNFSAQPNEVAENRFEIVNRDAVTTDINTIVGDNAARGIYTMMGQYVGQDWNALPAGVYVVDGVKVVK